MKKLVVLLSLGLMLFVSACGGEKELVIKIPLVTWGGYAALFAANGGAQPSTNSLFYKYGKFKVELVQEENPANQLQGFAKGSYQIIWSTMDMLPLHYDSLSKDTRTVPQVLGLFDFSAGGDGIIVRGDIKSAADMKGKKIVTAQYTPSHYFIMWYLDQAGLTEKDVNMIYVSDAILAKDTYINDKDISVCVTWSPFIYDITDPTKDTYVSGSKLLTTTAPGNDSYGLIADVYLARKDLVQEHPEVIDAFARAMIEGYDIFMRDQDAVAEMIAGFFGLKGGAEEVKLMFGDVTIGGKKENLQFFDAKNKFSAYNIFNISTELYKKNGAVLPADFAVDPNSVIYNRPIITAAQ